MTGPGSPDVEALVRTLADAARQGAADALAVLYVTLTLPPIHDDADERVLHVVTTRARSFIHRVARGCTITRITDDDSITVTASRRPSAGAPDLRPMSGGDCRTRTQPPAPMDGRSELPDDRQSRARDGQQPRADPARRPSNEDEV